MSVQPSRSVRPKVTARAVRLAATSTGVMVLALAFVAPSSAKRIYKSVPTHLALSATRAADGTVTATGVYTSPNPRCLSAKRFQKLHKGTVYYNSIGAGLGYGGPWSSANTNLPIGADGFGDFPGSSPLPGWLWPVSPFGQSPLVWQSIAPGNALVKNIEDHSGPTIERYDSTVAAASGVDLAGDAPSGDPRNVRGPFISSYHQGGNRIILKCPYVTARLAIAF